ncbi:MAG: glycoside hydrolase [Porphyromonadaceae bacterium]|nr:glycoside hydrolase [Porphyromonadaceae bacterium]
METAGINSRERDEMMRKYSRYILLFLTLFVSVSLFAGDGWERMKEIEKSIVPPIFPDENYLVTDFGAKNEEGFDCRPAINAAIVKCSENGGGKVIVPSGKYYVGGSIFMKSNVNLHFEEGCEIIFSSRSEDYLPLVLTRWEGTELYNYSPLIYAYNAINIAITGKGKLDGNGAAEIANWKPRQSKAQKMLREMGRTGVPVPQRLFGEGHYLRPAFIELFSCDNILIEDIFLTNSPFWLIHPVYCNNVTVRRVFVDSRTLNSDGCDPESSSNILIEDCHFISKDDGIAIKAGRDNDAWRVGRPTENVIIRNSVFESATNGICIGSEMSGGVRNIFVENVTVPKAGNALYFKSNLDRGGYIENVRVRNITVDSVSVVVKFDPDYKSESQENYPTRFNDFLFENISCNYAEEFGADISGFEKKTIQQVTIRNMTVKEAGQPVRIRNAEKVELNNVVINGQQIEFGKPNKTVSLNGIWDISVGNEMPREYNSSVQVPGIITMAKPLPGNDLDGIDSKEIPYDYVWYRTRFLLNEPDYPGAILHLRAKYNAAVWLNGIEIGYDHHSTYSHAEFDISRALKTKGENELVVRVGSWNTSSAPSKENSSEWWRNTRAPGIWDDVWIDLEQSVAVSHVKILPDTEKGIIVCDVEVKSKAESASDLTISASVFDRHDKLTGRETALKIKQNSMETTSIEIPVAMLTFWSPGKEGNPKCYRLNVKVMDSTGKILVDRDEMFGYRSIKTSGKDVLLNGQKIIFRAENIAFVRALTRWADFMFDENQIRKFLRAAVQDYNFNYLRIHLGHAYSKWYEIADQEGIMIQDEWRFMHDEEPVGKDLEETETEFKRWIRQNINHPSIVTWDQENEGNVRLEKLKQELRAYDPTRLWGEDDFIAKHIYQYSENIVSDPSYPVPDTKPMTILESCRLWTNEFGLLEPRENFKTSHTASGWGVYYYDKELIGQLLADLHADLGTYFRSSRIQAWAPFALLSGWVNGQNFFLGDIGKALNPQPNLLVLKKINEPVGLSIDLLQAREWYKEKKIYKPGNSNIQTVNIWNDFPETQTGSMWVSVKNISGEIISKVACHVAVGGYQSVKQKVTLTIPKEKGIYFLEPTLLLDNGKTIEGVIRRIMVASKLTKEMEGMMGFGGSRTRKEGDQSVIHHFLGVDLSDNLEKKIISIVGNGLLDKLTFDEKAQVYNIQSTIYDSPTRSKIYSTTLDTSGNIVSLQKSEARNYSELPENIQKTIVHALGVVPIDESKITETENESGTLYEISMFNSDTRHRLTFSKQGELIHKETNQKKR